jgi:hypothetical protein
VTIRELIDALTELEREHGPDVPVFHHDDWDYFLVDSVEFSPPVDDDGYKEPASVALTGETTRACELPGGSDYKESK